MINKRIVILFYLFLSTALYSSEVPVGFLWYNLPIINNIKKSPQATQKNKKSIPFNQLSYTDRDKVLRFYTLEALHKARYTKSMKDMRIFLALQDYWLRESSRFSTLFQQTLLQYPHYDYSVTASNIQCWIEIN